MGASSSTASASDTAVLDFSGADGKLYCNGKQFSIKGVNWFGSEAYNGPPGGLEHHSVDWFMDWLKRHRFNAIRLLFTHEYVLKDDIVEAPEGEPPGGLLFQVRYVANEPCIKLVDPAFELAEQSAVARTYTIKGAAILGAGLLVGCLPCTVYVLVQRLCPCPWEWDPKGFMERV